MKVKAIQDKNFRDRKLKKGVMALKKSKPVPDDVNFHCRKCNEAVCQAHDIRRVRETFYVIINSDVRESKVDALSLTAVKHMYSLFALILFSFISNSLHKKLQVHGFGDMITYTAHGLLMLGR